MILVQLSTTGPKSPAVPYINRDELMKWAGQHQLQEGRRLYEAGAIKDMKVEGNVVRGTISFGSRDMSTRFEIFKDGSVENLCPCRDCR